MAVTKKFGRWAPLTTFIIIQKDHIIWSASCKGEKSPNVIQNMWMRSSLVAQWTKDLKEPSLLLLWLELLLWCPFDWSRSFCMLQMRPKEKEKEKKINPGISFLSLVGIFRFSILKHLACNFIGWWDVLRNIHCPFGRWFLISFVSTILQLLVSF